MQYCNKCKKIIEEHENTYRGLCLHCYQEYLFEKIDHLEDSPIDETSTNKNTNKFIRFIRNIFSKKKK